MPVTIPENYVSGGFAMEYEVPWMTPGAVKKLDHLLLPSDHVIEVGTGGSTLFFARRAQSVIGIEPAVDWADSVVAETKRRGIQNAHIIAEPDPAAVLGIAHRLGGCTVLSVDPDDGYDRDELQDILSSRAGEQLEVVVMDNYGAESLFSRSFNWTNDQVIASLPGTGWEGEAFDDPKWRGHGTRVFWRRR
ncbi:MAG: hypothetical protein EBT18_04380 [Gammaproteobacteria bacterium]|nr:hypothetical protein [Gammaproteobacteria bacterium]